MIVDTSAIIAIFSREPQWERLLASIENAPSRTMSAVTALELTIVLSAPRFGISAVETRALLESLDITISEFTAEHLAAASMAHSRFGRGNHPARLNFGDCAAYATATVAGEPLLFVGDDLSQTDVSPA